ncbi:hypothetical protein, partial [Aromatoleum aromaticum]|uniref:hypothetical protein n=1 Tax=Aromatoleum aromaticum TaxID=551760 RepID=UPI001B7D0CA4
QRIFTDFCEHSIFAMPDLPEDNPATAATQYPHLSVVQLFKEPPHRCSEGANYTGVIAPVNPL